ncbi:unnamed protein product [Mytilus edulis]|uniref:SH3 domain-containing protein n=1 Tax=Mytilus edulis TaxID=6550 RepID=A0A8S3R8L6_MYTED|nr:unnamed protein product [Mytilus edulis]
MCAREGIDHVIKNLKKKASCNSVNKSCAKSSKKGQNRSVGCKRKRQQEKKKNESDSHKPGTIGVGKYGSEWAIDSKNAILIRTKSLKVIRVKQLPSSSLQNNDVECQNDRDCKKVEGWKVVKAFDAFCDGGPTTQLLLKHGEIIRVAKKNNSDWWCGFRNKEWGWFPKLHVNKGDWPKLFELSRCFNLEHLDSKFTLIC